MSNGNQIIGKKGFLAILILVTTVLTVGLVLMALGFNEELYSDSSTVRAVFTAITYLGEPIVFIVMIGLFYFRVKDFRLSCLQSCVIIVRTPFLLIFSIA